MKNQEEIKAKSKALCISIFPEQKKILEKAANSRGLSLSGFLKSAALEKVKREDLIAA